MPVGEFHELEHQAADLLRDRLPRLDTVRLTHRHHRASHRAASHPPLTETTRAPIRVHVLDLVEAVAAVPQDVTVVTRARACGG